MDITKLLEDVSMFMQIVQKRRISVDEIIDDLKKRISIVNEQLEVHSSAKQAAIPSHILNQFPDLKARVMSKLCCFIDEEINEITKAIYRLQEIAMELRKSYEKIQSCSMQIDWNEHIPYLTAFSQIAEWMDTCWKRIYLSYVRYNNALKSFHADDNHSSRWLNAAQRVDGTTEANLVVECWLVDLLRVLKKDILSRDKIATVTKSK